MTCHTDTMIETTSDTLILTYKYRLLPTKQQHARLDAILREQWDLYNTCLRSRIDHYARATHANVRRSALGLDKIAESISRYDQQKQLTQWRQQDPENRVTPVDVQRSALRRLDAAYKSFFARVKKKAEKAGFPKFCPRDEYLSFDTANAGTIQWDGKRVRMKSIPGGIRVHLHRPIPQNAEMRSAKFIKEDRRWFICFAFKFSKPVMKTNGSARGFDLNVSNTAAISDGRIVVNQKPFKASETVLAAANQALAMFPKNKRSRKRRQAKGHLRAVHRKIARQRNTRQHQLTAHWAREHRLLAIEDLNVKGMVQGIMPKAMHDASMGGIRQKLEYKCVREGTRLIAVNPAYTSQACSQCGTIVPKTLSDRLHSCPSCGLVIDRDVNAARVILRRAVEDGKFGFPVVTPSRKRGKVPENTDKAMPNLVPTDVKNPADFSHLPVITGGCAPPGLDTVQT